MAHWSDVCAWRFVGVDWCCTRVGCFAPFDSCVCPGGCS